MTRMVEIDERIKSRPEYPPVRLLLNRQQQVFISADTADERLQQMFEQCQQVAGAERVRWLKPAPASSDDRIAAQLAEPLADLPLSTAIYMAAEEAVMWDWYNALLALDFAPEQIQMLAPRSSARRLFCTHCYTVMEGVTESPVTCSGCGELLLVRDHFNKLHGAYVGVSINAEDRTEVPATEALQ